MLSHVCVQIFFRFKFLRQVHRVLFVSKDLIYDYKFEICFKIMWPRQFSSLKAVAVVTSSLSRLLK